MTHEIMMKRNNEDESKKHKNVAFRIEDNDKDSQDSEDDDFSLLARKFKRKLTHLMSFDVLNVKS